MESAVLKRSIVIAGQKTSVSIEDTFWTSLKEIARARGVTLSRLVAAIKADRVTGSNLSSAIRVYILGQYLAQKQALTHVGNAPSPAPDARATSTHDSDRPRGR